MLLNYVLLLQQLAFGLALCGAVVLVGFEPTRKILVKLTIAPIVYVIYIVGVGLAASAEKERVRRSMIVSGGRCAA
nr:MAG TPA: hypothetical protein [Caudoviricetes sp.]